MAVAIAAGVLSLLGSLAGVALTYYLGVRRAERDRRATLFAEAVSAVVVDEANINFPVQFRVSSLRPEEQDALDKEARMEGYRRRRRGLIDCRTALARVVPYAPEVEPYLDLLEMNELQRRELLALLKQRLARVEPKSRQLAQLTWGGSSKEPTRG